MEKFSYENNGYKRSEVNSFIKEVIKETELLIAKIRQQESQIEELNKKLSYYDRIETSLDSVVIKTTEKSDEIINEAKSNASRIVNEALLRAEKIEHDRDILVKNMKIFKKKLKIIMEQQMAVVDEIDELELSE